VRVCVCVCVLNTSLSISLFMERLIGCNILLKAVFPKRRAKDSQAEEHESYENALTTRLTTERRRPRGG